MELHRDTILRGLVTHVYSWPSVGKMTRPVLREFCREILSHEQRFRSSKRHLRYRNQISYVRSKQAKFSRERQIFLAFFAHSRSGMLAAGWVQLYAGPWQIKAQSSASWASIFSSVFSLFSYVRFLTGIRKALWNIIG